MDEVSKGSRVTKVRDAKIPGLLGIWLLIVLLVSTIFFIILGGSALRNIFFEEQAKAGDHTSLANRVSDADSDLTAFLGMVELATGKARQVTSDVTLRQAIVDQETATFFFTDAAATQEFLVKVPVGDELARLDNLTVEMTDPAVAHYIDRPARGLNFDSLRIGPECVKQTIMEQATGCDFSHLVLYPEGNTLIWLAFCATDEGLVSGRMNSRTGDFHLEPLATWPTVATPIP